MKEEEGIHLCCFVLLGVVKDKEGNPEPVDVFKRKSILRSRILQIQIFDAIVVPLGQNTSPKQLIAIN